MQFEHRVVTETHDSQNALDWRVNMGASTGGQCGIVYMEARVSPNGEWQKIVGVSREGELLRYMFRSYREPVSLPYAGKSIALQEDF